MLQEVLNLRINMIIRLGIVNRGNWLIIFLCGSPLSRRSSLATLCRRCLPSLTSSFGCDLLLILLPDSLPLLIKHLELLLRQLLARSLLLPQQELLSRQLRLLSPTWLVSLPRRLQSLFSVLLVCVLDEGQGFTAVDLDQPGDVR